MILFEKILLHFCLKSFYWSLHCDKKCRLRILRAYTSFKKVGTSSLIEVYVYMLVFDLATPEE